MLKKTLLLGTCALLTMTGCTAVEQMAAEAEVGQMASSRGSGGIVGVESVRGNWAERPAVAADTVSAITQVETAPAYAGGGNGGEESQSMARQRITSIFLVYSVSDVKQAIKEAEAIAKDCNGYVQSIGDYNVILRIPADALTEANELLSKLGTLQSRQEQVEDVTGEMFDVETRIGNLEKLRERLLAIADKAVKVEDMLMVEKELNRVSGELELLKGRLNLLRNQVNYATIRIGFNEVIPVTQRLERRMPVPWVAELGGEILSNANRFNAVQRFPYDVALPEDFIVTYSDGRQLLAISPDRKAVQLQRCNNLKGGSLKFWQETVKRALEEANFYRIDEVREIVIGEGIPAVEITAHKMIGDENWYYRVYVFLDRAWYDFCGEGEVYLYEFQAPEAGFGKDKAAVGRLLETVDLSMWK